MTWATGEMQGATTKETNSSGTLTGTNELDPLARSVDSSGAYNYDGTNDYGVPAAGFYTPGSVPGVCGTTLGVSMSCAIVNDSPFRERSIQERIADNDWSLSRLRPNGEFWDNLDRGYVLVPEFEDRRDQRTIVYRKHPLWPKIDDWYRNLNTTQQANIAVDDCARRMFGVSMIAGGNWAQQGTSVANLNFAPLEGTAILLYSSSLGVVGTPVKTFSVFMDRAKAGSAELGGPSSNAIGRARQYPSTGIYQTTDPDTGKSRFTNRGYVIDSTNGIGEINEVYGGLVNVYFGVQIHETGNVLASLTGKKH